MLSNYILPGDKVELQMVKRVKAEEQKLYASKVYEVVGNDRLQIMMPMEKSKLVIISPNQECCLYFYTKTGMYQCLMKTVNRLKAGTMYILELEPVTNLKKFQRREFYRYNCAIDFELRYLTAMEINQYENGQVSINEELPFNKGLIVDISGGGMRFIADEQYGTGRMLCCQFQLIIGSQSREYTFISSIINSNAVENKNGSFEHRMQFKNITNRQREEIIRYIFEEERKVRQREKG